MQLNIKEQHIRTVQKLRLYSQFLFFIKKTKHKKIWYTPISSKADEPRRKIRPTYFHTLFS